jgi:hypothetical protein
VADGNTFINAGFSIAAKHIAMRNNRFYNGLMALDVHPLVGMSDSVTIVGNSSYGRGVNELVSGSATNTVIKNNILCTNTTDDWAAGLSLGNAIGNYQIDYNLYYAPNKPGKGNLWFVVNGVELGRSSFSSWQAAGGDVHGKYANPLFLSTDSSSTDFLKLGSGSPAIGAGAMAGDAAPVFCDFDGNPRAAGQITDIGARLYGTQAVVQGGKGRRTSAPAVSRQSSMSTNRTYNLDGRVVKSGDVGSKSHAAAMTLRTKGVTTVRELLIAP